METNQNLVPELYSAQFTTPIPSESELETQTDSEQPLPEAALLYDPQKMEQIAQHLRELLDPDFILLFGTLAGGTPHSQTNTCDLLVIVDETPYHNWYGAKRYLKTRMPKLEHRMPYINLYVLTAHQVEANFTPFIYFSRREGILLYRKCGQKFKRPRKAFDFGQAAAHAQKYSNTFLSLADQLVDYAEKMIDWSTVRLAALAMAQATVYYYRTLYYIYHGFEADTYDVEMLQKRLRLLSGELMLVFEIEEYDRIYTLRCLKIFLEQAQYDPKFFVFPAELIQHLERVKQFGKIVSKLCEQRIELYKSRSGQ